MLCERIIQRALGKLRCQVFESVTVQHIFHPLGNFVSSCLCQALQMLTLY